MSRVELRNVVKGYGAHTAVKDVSLTVGHGEFVALVGPSGCGKTTTLNLVAGLTELSGGDILIGGHVVNDLDPKDRDIAMVFQNYALYPNKTIYKNLAFPLQMRRLPRAEVDAKVRAAAKALEIEHLLERRPRELSGGQQQRVALGRALVRDPQVFLMDEPLSNLDAKLRVQMRAEIKRFHQDMEATVIYVTHDQLEALTMADKMAVMNGGSLQQFAAPDEVFANPANVFVAGFVGSPAMNLLPVRAVGEGTGEDGGCVLLRSADGWTYALDGRNARKALAASTPDLVLGVRHGAVGVHPEPVDGAVAGRIYTMEPTGDITFAHVAVGRASVVASMAPEVKLRRDQPVWLRFEKDKLHLFDGATRLALRA